MEKRTDSPYPRLDRPVLAVIGVVLVVVGLTIVGTFLRGPSWQFYWPWQAWPELPTRI